jgi:hypothetical protein
MTDTFQTLNKKSVSEKILAFFGPALFDEPVGYMDREAGLLMWGSGLGILPVYMVK